MKPIDRYTTPNTRFTHFEVDMRKTDDVGIILGAVRTAQKILAKQLEPGGLSDHQALNELHGALDNPIVIEAQKRLGDDPTKGSE